MATRVRAPEPQEALTPVAYRALQPHDLAGVTALERRIFSTPWDETAFGTFLRPGPAFARVAVAGDAIVGYALGWCAPPEAELMNLAVDERWRNRGIGSALLAWTLEACAGRGAREVYLEVRLSNWPAQRLYERHGFEPYGRRRNYYANPREDALVLRARVAPLPPRQPRD
jgi:ribosomal-protein-alanine N-acetyltransferase